MMRQYALFLGLGMELAGLIVVFLFLGRELDDWLQWQGIGIAISVGIAMAIWIFHLSIAMKRLGKTEKDGE
tara:strand:- start:1843 stop:2055 length:213 start_codon:yes stop_codon:yes gene_type:complete